MATSIEIYPENWLSYEAFNAMAGQWHFRPSGMGPGIPVALKYEAIPMALRMAGISRKEWARLYPDLKVMERAALEVMQAD